jgi:hypothetical protein
MNSFQDITRQALTTNYSSNDHFDGHTELRLATKIVNRNDVFSKDMASWGHKYDFAREADGDDNGSNSELKYEDDDVESTCAVVGVEHLKIRKISDTPDLRDLVHNMETDKVDAPESHIHSWIEKQYRESRGFEIGTFSSTLLAMTMKQQSDKWPSIAHGYISDVVTMTHRFILKALDTACPDGRVRRNLISVLMDRILGRYEDAITKVNYLLSVERSGTPMTLNHYLNSNLEKWYSCIDGYSVFLS